MANVALASQRLITSPTKQELEKSYEKLGNLGEEYQTNKALYNEWRKSYGKLKDSEIKLSLQEKVLSTQDSFNKSKEKLFEALPEFLRYKPKQHIPNQKIAKIERLQKKQGIINNYIEKVDKLQDEIKNHNKKVVANEYGEEGLNILKDLADEYTELVNCRNDLNKMSTSQMSQKYHSTAEQAANYRVTGLNPDTGGTGAVILGTMLAAYLSNKIAKPFGNLIGRKYISHKSKKKINKV